jgi:acyl-CoA oxidase
MKVLYVSILACYPILSMIEALKKGLTRIKFFHFAIFVVLLPCQIESFGIVEKEIAVFKPRPFEMSEEENRKATMSQMKRLIELWREMTPEAFDVVRHAMLMYDRATSMRFYVHVTLFCETLRTQGTKEQVEEILNKAERGEIFGCFAMTELCHSSFLRGIETEATYDSSKEEFELNSTTLGATKWWIGGAGQTATHAVVLANLIPSVGGPVWFVVQLRDVTTGSLMPGVDAGHLGPKAGRDGLDSGWIRFSKVRVSKASLLSRFLSIETKRIDGNLRKDENSQSSKIITTFSSMPKSQHLAYNTLIGERLQALSEAASSAAQASSIATRYAIVRRQGPRNPQIIDFKVQYTTLLPIICTSMVVTTVHSKLFPSWNQLVMDGNTTPDLVSDWHSTAACLKSLWTWWSMESIEKARRSMGGHAFSSFNAITGIWGDSGVLTTGGGDNYVLSQQCSSYIIKSYMTSGANKKKKKLFGKSLSYLADASRYKTFGLDWPLEKKDVNAWTLPETRDLLNQLLKAWRAAIVFMIDAIVVAHSLHQNWNEQMNELIELSNFHAFQLSLEVMIEVLDAADAKVQPILSDILLLHSLHHATQSERSNVFLEHNVFTPTQFTQLKKHCQEMAKKMRKNAALLVDAFAFPDFVLKSPLARFDGNIYEPYFEMVKRANTEKVAPYWASEIATALGAIKTRAKL